MKINIKISFITLFILIILCRNETSFSQTITPSGQTRGYTEFWGGLIADSVFKIPTRTLIRWGYTNSKITNIGLLQVNPLDSLPYYGRLDNTWWRILTANDTGSFQKPLSLTTTGTSGMATFLNNILNIPVYQSQGNYITGLTGDITATGPGSVAATIATVNPNTGTFGSASVVPQITFNAKGQATAVATIAISASPSGAAGGDLTGTYPNPTIATVNSTPATYGSATIIPIVVVNSKGQVTAITTTNVTATTNANLTGPITSVGNATSIASQTGTGTTFAMSASPSFTGTVTMTAPFTLGATSVTSTGTQLNYLSSATGTTGTNSTNVVFSTNPTLAGITISNATNIVCNGSTGVKLASTSSEKLGFWGATPVVRQSGSVITGLQTMGLMTSATISASEVSGLADASQTATDANYTVTSPTTIGTIVNLPVITSGRNLLLPSPSSFSGYTLKIWNKNTSGSAWTFTTNAPLNAAGSALTTLTNSVWYIVISDGTNWVKTN